MYKLLRAVIVSSSVNEVVKSVVKPETHIYEVKLYDVRMIDDRVVIEVFYLCCRAKSVPGKISRVSQIVNKRNSSNSVILGFRDVSGHLVQLCLSLLAAERVMIGWQVEL